MAVFYDLLILAGLVMVFYSWRLNQVWLSVIGVVCLIVADLYNEGPADTLIEWVVIITLSVLSVFGQRFWQALKEWLTREADFRRAHLEALRRIEGRLEAINWQLKHQSPQPVESEEVQKEEAIPNNN
jgi:hypothetical protein